ncbi:MAG: cytochrome c oxidase subunit 3 [Fimbriimonadaceae bacterium]|nr:cytochrome c oxidase subunit 3 [Chitinophagales bacterium]
MQQYRSSEQLKFSKNPLVLIVHLLLAGIVILFLGLCYGYLFSLNQDKWEDFRLPKIFWLSSVCVIIISFSLRKCHQFYKKDKPKTILQFMLIALFFAVGFLICQYMGWMQMQKAGFTLADTPSSSYIYILSGLHGLHIIAGIIFLIVAVFRMKKNIQDEVSALLFLSDETKYIRLRLLTHYWHTIDFLWIFLFILFLYQHA